jgi:hypothetical protein
MKNQIARASLALLLSLQPAVVTLAQQTSRQELFDSKKSNRDLEVMKGIIRTTLGFVAEEVRGTQAGSTRGALSIGMEYYGSSSISAYYLVGQGAVFTIPSSSLSRSANAVFEGDEHYLALNEEMAAKTEALTRQAAEMQVEAAKLAAEASAAALSGVPKATAPAIAATAPTPFAQPTPPAVAVVTPQPKARSGGSGVGVSGGVVGGVPGGVGTTGVNEEKVRQKLVTVQDRMKRQQESFEQRKAKFNESLVQFKAALIEAMASHGDTLSQVKPNEYITIIISEDNRMLPQSQVLSVQKSTISDYKAGRISLEAFRAKVLDYSTE